MKKTALLLFLAALAFRGVSSAQNLQGTEVQGRLSRPSPSPAASAAPTSGKLEAMLATDDKGKNTATTFASNTPAIYLVTKNVSGAKGDKVRAQWVADDTGKVLPKNKTLTDVAIILPDAKLYAPSFNQPAPLKGAFPPGKYHVALYVGDKMVDSVRFAVK